MMTRELKMKMLDETLNVFVLALSVDQRLWLEERAGILESDAGMDRIDAERMAYRITAAEFGLNCLLED